MTLKDTNLKICVTYPLLKPNKIPNMGRGNLRSNDRISIDDTIKRGRYFPDYIKGEVHFRFKLI